MKVPFTEKEDVRVFPNLTTGILYIGSGDNGDLRYRILNSMGDLILDGLLESREYLDISDFSSGLYYLELKKGNQSTIKKIIKTE